MKYPNWLVEMVADRSKGFLLEGFVPGAGPLDAELLILGEAPGRNEIETLTPFSGAAGVELDKSLALAGLTRDQIYITSAVRSRPYSVKTINNKKTGQPETKRPNRTPTKKEVLAHAPITDYEIQQIQPQVIVTLGNIGLQRLLGPDHSISKDHGQVFITPIQVLTATQDGYRLSDKPYAVVPMFHPAAVFYNRKLTDLIEQDWSKLDSLLQQKS